MPKQAVLSLEQVQAQADVNFTLKQVVDAMATVMRCWSGKYSMRRGVDWTEIPPDRPGDRRTFGHFSPEDGSAFVVIAVNAGRTILGKQKIAYRTFATWRDHAGYELVDEV